MWGQQIYLIYFASLGIGFIFKKQAAQNNLSDNFITRIKVLVPPLSSHKRLVSSKHLLHMYWLTFSSGCDSFFIVFLVKSIFGFCPWLYWLINKTCLFQRSWTTKATNYTQIPSNWLIWESIELVAFHIFLNFPSWTFLDTLPLSGPNPYIVLEVNYKLNHDYCSYIF